MAQYLNYGGFGKLKFSDQATPEEMQAYVDKNYKAIENRFNVPPSDVSGSLASYLPFDSVERGFREFQKAFNVLQLKAGVNTPDEAIYDIRRYENRIKQIPQDEEDTKTLTKIVKAKGIGETFSALAENPGVLLPVIGESIGRYLPTLTLGAAPPALLARGVAGSVMSAVGTGAGSTATEYGASFIDSLTEAGMDIDDGLSMIQAFNDPKLMAKAQDFAVRRGVPIGAFDALAFGTAGILTRAVRDSGKKLLGSKLATTLGTGAGEIGIAGSLGAMGEATAQVLSEGRITSPGSVILEAVAEGPIGLVETSLNTLNDKYEVDTEAEETNPGGSIKKPKLKKKLLALPAPKELEMEPGGRDVFEVEIEEGGKKIPMNVEEVKRVYNNLLKQRRSNKKMTPEQRSKSFKTTTELFSLINSTTFKNAERRFNYKKTSSKTEVKQQISLSPEETKKIKSIISGKLYNYLNQRAEDMTKDGLGGQSLDPQKIRREVLSEYEIQFLEDNNIFGESDKLEADVYNELIKQNKINVETRVDEKDGQKQVKPLYFTVSPFDVSQIEKVKKAQDEFDAQPTIKEKIVPSSLRFPFDLQVLSKVQQLFKDVFGTPEQTQRTGSLQPLSSTLKTETPQTVKNLYNSLEKSFNKFKQNKLLDENPEVKYLLDRVKDSKDLKELTEQAIAEQNTPVQTKIIKDQNNSIQGLVQKIALPGKSFINPSTGRAQGTPGPGFVYAAVDKGKANNVRLFMTEQEAGDYLNKTLKKRTIEIPKVGRPEMPNLQQDLFKNIREEVKAAPDLDVMDIPARRLFLVQQLISNSRQPELQGQEPTAQQEKPAVDSVTAEKIVETALSSTPEINSVDLENDDIDARGDRPQSIQETRDERTLFKKATDTLSFLGKSFVVDLFKPWINSLKQLAATSKPLGKVLNVLGLRDQMRGRIKEQLDGILQPWTDLNTDEAAKVYSVAIFARAMQTKINKDSPYRISENEIFIPETALRSDKMAADDDLTIKDLLPRFFPIPAGGLRLTGNEVKAYDALLEMGEFERGIIINQSYDLLKEKLDPETSVPILNKIDPKQLNSKENLEAAANQIESLFINSKEISDLDTTTLKRFVKQIRGIAKNFDTTYVPLSRNGDSFTSVTEMKLDTTQNKLIKRTRFWRAYDTADGKNRVAVARAKKVEDQLKQMFPTSDTVMDPETGEAVQRYVHSGVQTNNLKNISKNVGPEFFESLDSFLQLVNTKDVSKESKEFLKDRAEALQKSKGLPSFLTQAYMIPGFDVQDALESLGQHTNAFSTWDANFVFEDRFNEVISNKDFNTQERKYVDTLVNYLDRDPYEFQAFRQTAFIYYLTDISASVMNLFQGVPGATYISTYSGFRKAGKGQIKAMKDLIKAIKPTTRSDNQFDMSELSKIFKDIPIFQNPDALLASVINPSRTNEYIGNQTTKFIKGTRLAMGPKGSPAKFERTARLMGLMFTTSEIGNRLATYINSYRQTMDPNVLRKALKVNLNDSLFTVRIQDNLNLDPETVLDNFSTIEKDAQLMEQLRDLVAQSAVEETQFIYGRHAKPQISRGIGALLFQFSEYPTMMLELMKRLAFDRGPEGRAAFKKYMLALLVTSGFMGLPFVADFKDLYDLLSGGNLEREYYDTMGEVLPPKINELLLRGASRTSGIDIGGRVGLGTHPISGALIDMFRGQTGLSRTSVPAYSIFKGVLDAKSYASVDETGLAVASLLPKVAGAPLRAALEYTQGYKSKNGNMVIPPVDAQGERQITGYDTFMRALGFSPADISRKREALWLQKSLKDANAPLRGQFYRRLQKHMGDEQRALRNNDTKALYNARKDIQDVYDDLKEHNDQAITSKRYYEVIDLKSETIEDNLMNELFGASDTLNNLPSDVRFDAIDLGKKLPGGID